MSKSVRSSFWSRLMSKVRNSFFSGLFLVIPIVASVWIIVFGFTLIDELLQPLIRKYINVNIPGLGFGVIVVSIFLLGLVTNNYVGKRIVKLGDSLLRRIPFFRVLYSSAKQVTDGFADSGTMSRAAFREVILVEFPANALIPAFITNEFISDSGEKYYTIYIPTTPTPWTGFASIVAANKVTRVNISIDEAIKMCISGMMISPAQFSMTSGETTTNLSIARKDKQAETPTP